MLFGVIAILLARINLIAYKRTLPNLKMTEKPEWKPKHWQNDVLRYALGLSFKNIINHPSENSTALKVSATVRWKDINDNLRSDSAALIQANIERTAIKV